MYTLLGKSYTEDPSDKLGSGSEGTVYRFHQQPHTAVKIYHPAQNAAERAIADFRARKLKAMQDFDLKLPKQFVLPQHLTYDEQGLINGFLMSLVPSGYQKLIQINKMSFRQDNKIGLRWVMEFFAGLFDELDNIHEQGLVVGDVNMGCMLFKDPSKRAWVDTDSWGFKGHPCVATTENFAHPDLYPNLERGGKLITAQAEHDRFAFLVMMTLMSIPGAHPFRMGSHPSVSGLRNRAEAGITIFDQGVRYPKIVSPEILSDELLDMIIARLKRKEDTKLNTDELRAFAEEVISCDNCGIEHHATRKHCPSCQKKSMVDLTSLAKLLIKRLYNGSGSILHLQVQGNQVRVVCRVNDHIEIIIVSNDGKIEKIVTGIPALRGSRYRLAADVLVVCQDPHQDGLVPLKVYGINNGGITKMNDLSTMAMAGESAVFDTSQRFVYRIAGNMLVRGERYGQRAFHEQPIMQVYQTQSWFTADRVSRADREVLFGYDRALKDWQWFVISGDKDGSNFRHNKVESLTLKPHERLEDFAVYFASTLVLLVRQTSLRGQAFVRYSVISLDGTVVQDTIVQDGETGYEYWHYLHGKCFQGSSVLHVTPKGITKQVMGTNQYTHLGDTDGVVMVNDRLLRFGKEILIARPNALLTLSKK